MNSGIFTSKTSATKKLRFHVLLWIGAFILNMPGCGSSTDSAVKNDLEIFKISINAFCNNKQHYPVFSGMVNGESMGWRPQIFTVAVPSRWSEGESFFVDRSGRLFELNFPVVPSAVHDLADLPGHFVVGCQTDIPDNFDWTKPSKLAEIPENEIAIGTIIGIDGDAFFLLLADGTVLKLKTDTPSKVLKPFFDEKEAKDASMDRLDTWRVD